MYINIRLTDILIRYLGFSIILSVYTKCIVSLFRKVIMRLLVISNNRQMKAWILVYSPRLSFLSTNKMWDLWKTDIEEITREDLKAFVKHEQDRGLTMVSVKTRLSAVYALLRFWHDKGVISPELLVRKIRLRLPEPRFRSQTCGMVECRQF